MHYLNDQGCTGWQGKIEDLEHFQELKARGEPSPMLRIAEKWLRAELVEKKRRLLQGEVKVLEEQSGQAVMEQQSNMQARGGGFAAGRMAGYDFIK